MSGIVRVMILCSLVSATLSVVDLQESRLSAGYRKVLDEAYTRLNGWCLVQQKPKIEDIQHSFAELNGVLVEHVQFLYQNNFGVSAGRHAILCVQNRHRHTRSFLAQAWDSIKAWERIVPIKLRTPLPYLVLQAMFCYAMLTGFSSSGTECRDWISFGIGILCSFDALLRPGEWCALTSGLIALPSTRLQGMDSRGLLTIKNGKNRRLFGRIQIGIVESPVVLAWLTWLVENLPSDVPLMAGGTGKFRALFKKAVAALRLDELDLVPSSLRAGGATYKFAVESLDIGRLQYRGRWSSARTLQHYLQEAGAILAMLRLEDQALKRLELIVKSGSVFLKPPTDSWRFFFSRDAQLRSLWTSRTSNGQFLPRKR